MSTYQSIFKCTICGLNPNNKKNMMNCRCHSKDIQDTYNNYFKKRKIDSDVSYNNLVSNNNPSKKSCISNFNCK
jgi:hypothetical protein